MRTNTLLSITLVLVLAMTFTGCQSKVAGSSEAGSVQSMKGFELYSWQAEGGWAFALVVGTNRLKTVEEISSPEVRLEGLDALKRELDRLAPGEWVFWSEGRVPNTALPAVDVIREVRAYCEQRGLHLEIQAGDVSWVLYPSLGGIRSLAFGPDGSLWAGTESGVVRWDLATDTPIRYSTADGLVSDDVTDLAFAPDGTLWVATREGVNRFDGIAWETVARREDRHAGNVRDIVFTPDDAAWMANGFTLARFDGQSWTSYERLVNSLALAPDGAIWMNGWEGTQGSEYVARFDGESWTTYRSADSYPGGFMVGAVTSDGAVWGITSGRGLASFDGQSWTDGRSWAFYGTADGLPSDQIIDLAVAPDGALWAITDRGIGYLGGRGWKSVGLDHSLGAVKAMAFAPDGSIWLGTSKGAAHVHP